MCMYTIYKDQQPLVLMLCVNPGPQARQARALSGSHNLGPLSCFFFASYDTSIYNYPLQTC